MRTPMLTLWKNLPLRKRYVVLREVVLLLSLFEYFGLGGGFLYLGRGELQQSAVFFALLAASFYTSSKLGWYTNEILIKLATGKE